MRIAETKVWKKYIYKKGNDIYKKQLTDFSKNKINNSS